MEECSAGKLLGWANCGDSGMFETEAVGSLGVSVLFVMGFVFVKLLTGVESQLTEKG